MADIADLTANNDFTEEMVLRQLSQPKTKQQRGRCLNCGASVSDLYCDDDCKSDYEYHQMVSKKQKR